MTPTVTAAQFRADFPAFKNDATFSDEQIEFWATVAAGMLNANRFGRQITLAGELFIAHNVALEAVNQLGADMGGIPGLARGVLTSESGAGTSASYDTSSTTNPKAGHWNMTVYGQRLWRLINFAGMGPIYVGGGSAALAAAILYGSPIPGWAYGPGWRSQV